MPNYDENLEKVEERRKNEVDDSDNSVAVAMCEVMVRQRNEKVI